MAEKFKSKIPKRRNTNDLKGFKINKIHYIKSYSFECSLK